MARFLALARAHRIRASDKVASHSYQLLYGLHLKQGALAGSASIKLLEIGLLGCSYIPRASVHLWRRELPTAGDFYYFYYYYYFFYYYYYYYYCCCCCCCCCCYYYL